MEQRKTALVVLASEQLWPNIHSLVHWAEHAPDSCLTDLCIYRTDDVSRSLQPAQRLRNLCSTLYPQIEVHFSDDLETDQQPELPEAVYTQILHWREKLPNRQWILNATGGLKLMFAGVLDCIALDDVTVVYRELSGTWYQLLQSDHKTVSRELHIQENTSHISVQTLVRAQWQIGEETTFHTDPPLHLSTAQLCQMVETGIKERWDWKAIFEHQGLSIGTGQLGPLFEKFAAAALLSLGVEQLVLNLKVKSQQGQSLHEIDIVANHGGRLLIIDCKLLNNSDETKGRIEGITSQIRQANATQRSWGGLNAKILMLRPNRVFTEDELSLADAYRIDVLDNNKAWTLFTHLAKFAGITSIPEDLLTAEALIKEQKSRGISTPLSPEPEWKTKIFPAEENRTILNLNRLQEEFEKEKNKSWQQYRREFLERYMKTQGQDWVAYQEQTPGQAEIGFVVANPEKWIMTELQKRLHPLSAWGSLKDVSRSTSGYSVVFVLVPKSKQDQEALSGYLRTKMGQSFWP